MKFGILALSALVASAFLVGCASGTVETKDVERWQNEGRAAGDKPTDPNGGRAAEDRPDR